MAKDNHLKPFTFPDSGETILAKPVSIAAIGIKLRRVYPKPLPPTQEAEVAPGRKQSFFNFSHPDYISSVDAWESAINEMAMTSAISRAVHRHLNDEAKKKIEQWKKDNAHLLDSNDTGDDWDLYFEEICLSTDRDVTALAEFIRGSEPTEEVIASAVESFPGDVQK